MRDDTTSQPEGVKVPAREIRFPTSISPQARAFLETMVQADGSLKAHPPLPPVNDHAAWAQVRKASETLFAGSRMTETARQNGTSVETRQIANVTVHVATPAEIAPEAKTRLYIDIHGGAFYAGCGAPSEANALLAAYRHKVKVYGIDYRVPPEHPYPAPLDDCLSIYRAALSEYDPDNIIIGGGSAGSNLAAALILRARDEGMPLPAAVVLLTPEADLTESGDSFQVNESADLVLQHSLSDSIAAYAGENDRSLPYLSPLFGDFTKGFPPTFLQAGTRDLFLSNAARFHRALRKAGVPVELHIFEGMPHGGFQGAPEDAELASEVDRFVAEHWRPLTK